MAALIITDEALVRRLQGLAEQQGETVEAYLAAHFGSRAASIEHGEAAQNADRLERSPLQSGLEEDADPLLVLAAAARQRGFRASRDDIAENFEAVLHDRYQQSVAKKDDERSASTSG